MHVLLLSDFSEVAINATHYAMDLLQDEKVHFTLLNIFMPQADCSEEAAEVKRRATKERLAERVEKLQERAKNKAHRVSGFYSEKKLINAARDFVEQDKVDLIVMGAVSRKFNHLTILGDHTFEIISKIKCNILAVPEDSHFEGLQRMLMPVDYTASFDTNNLQFLKSSRFFYNTKLSVREIINHSVKENVDKTIKQEYFRKLDNIRTDFSSLEDSDIYDPSTWQAVQNNYEMIVLLAKNLKICDGLLHNRHGLYSQTPNRLPILVLHD